MKSLKRISARKQEALVKSGARQLRREIAKGPTKQPPGWITRDMRGLREFAQSPKNWWLWEPGKPPDLQGNATEDYMIVKDNIVILARIDYWGPGRAPQAERRLMIGSDIYDCAELPMPVIDEAKRAFFDADVPMIQAQHEDPASLKAEGGGKAQTKNSYIVLRHEFYLPPGFILGAERVH